MTEITEKYFVSPRDAALIVGRESFGSNWSDDWIDDPNSEQCRAILATLRKALQSGQVAASYSNDYGEHEFKRTYANGDFFNIDLKRDRIFLSSSSPEPLECKLSSGDLVVFVRTEGRGKVKLTKSAETACEAWLVKLFSSDEPVPKTADLMSQAVNDFPGLSKAAYRRARESAILITGRTDLRAAGRRPNST